MIRNNNLLWPLLGFALFLLPSLSIFANAYASQANIDKKAVNIVQSHNPALLQEKDKGVSENHGSDSEKSHGYSGEKAKQTQIDSIKKDPNNTSPVDSANNPATPNLNTPGGAGQPASGMPSNSGY